MAEVLWVVGYAVLIGLLVWLDLPRRWMSRRRRGGDRDA